MTENTPVRACVNGKKHNGRLRINSQVPLSALPLQLLCEVVLFSPFIYLQVRFSVHFLDVTMLGEKNATYLVVSVTNGNIFFICSGDQPYRQAGEFPFVIGLAFYQDRCS